MGQQATRQPMPERRHVLESQYRSADDRRADGKALRKSAPRGSHAHWAAPKRRDPIDLLVKSNQGRLPNLVLIRFGRMMQSPFAFYRGAAAVMASDLASTPSSGIRVQACGDAHLSNFGGLATPEGRLIFDISDFDETLPGPWEWDLKRLAASVVLAGRQIRPSESDTARAVAATVMSYREHMADYGGMPALDVWYDAIDIDPFTREIEKESEEVVRRIEQRQFLFPKLVKHGGSTPRIMDDPPLIFHPTAEHFPGLETDYKNAIAFYRELLAKHIRVLFDRFQFCDLAIKVVGVGSVGTLCMLALFMASDDDPIFLQVKEANASVLEPYVGKSAHSNHGQRVVVGQRLMQSATDLFLGWTQGSDGRDLYVCQLRDMKVSAIVEDFDAGDLRAYGRACGWALARAHARSGDAAMIAGYMGASGIFDDAIAEFAVEYADQVHKDHRAFVRAIHQGRITAVEA